VDDEKATCKTKDCNKKAVHGPHCETHGFPRINQVSLVSLDTEDLRPRWLVDGWLEETDVALIIGDPYVGKSWLALHVGMSLARGKSWTDNITIGAAHRVLFIDEDNPDNTAKRRIQDYARKRLSQPSEWRYNFHYWVSNFITLQSLLDFTNVRGYFALIKKMRPRLVIIDTLYSFGNVDISNQKDVAALKTGLRRFQKLIYEETGEPIAFFILHHMKKKQESSKGELKATDIQRMYGSTFLHAMPDTIWILHKERNTFYLLQPKLRADPESGVTEPMMVQLGVK